MGHALFVPGLGGVRSANPFRFPLAKKRRSLARLYAARRVCPETLRAHPSLPWSPVCSSIPGYDGGDCCSCTCVPAETTQDDDYGDDEYGDDDDLYGCNRGFA